MSAGAPRLYQSMNAAADEFTKPESRGDNAPVTMPAASMKIKRRGRNTVVFVLIHCHAGVESNMATSVPALSCLHPAP